MNQKQQELLLGYKPTSEVAPPKYAVGKTAQPKPITADGSGHLMTIAPTGAGKGRSVLIPQLLHYQGPVVVMDPKGENVAVTYRRRVEMGHQVSVLDPFNVTSFPKAGLNPLDICYLDNADPETECQLVADVLGGKGFSNDPYWDVHAKSIISRILMYLILVKKTKEQTLNKLRSLLCEDPAYNLAVILDTEGKQLPRTVYEGIAGYLNTPSDKTRPCIDSTAMSYLTPLMSENVSKMVEKTTFDLQDFVEGKPIDIFICFPPDKMKSHSALLVLIVATLFKAMMTRRVIPMQKTLFLLDETAALKSFDYLETMVSLCRGYGALVHTFWQDLSQIKRYYGEGYMSIINNAAVWQIFGIQHYTIAKELAEITGMSAHELRGLKAHEQVLIINGKEYKKAQKLDYLLDPAFEGIFDPNPFFNLTKAV